jgi:hypothetical protein
MSKILTFNPIALSSAILLTTLDVAPEFVACDLHLDYRSTESTRASKDFLVERDGFEPNHQYGLAHHRSEGLPYVADALASLKKERSNNRRSRLRRPPG